MRRILPTVYREKALLVEVLLENTAPQQPRGPLVRSRLEPPGEPSEFELLAETAGVQVLGTLSQRRERIDPAFHIGKGKANELCDLVRQKRIDVVLFNVDLSPGQVRNLERLLETKVLDRTELILDIFATHARSKQAKLQVELAQLEYTLPRLRRMWTHLSRIAGGVGVGQRGPGEKQIEDDRRLARRRFTDLRREIQEIQEGKRREVAHRAQNFTVSLVGYTNAGKSTLMNRLTGTCVVVEDRLFSTLDTKTHTWELRSGQKVLLSDTVGFLRDLPHHLVASFHATLEEVRQADLLLHVMDATRRDLPDQVRAVRTVLRELACEKIPVLDLLNKIDRIGDPLEHRILSREYPGALLVSAQNGAGLEELDGAVDHILAERQVELRLRVPMTDGKQLAFLAEHGRILERQMDDGMVLVRVKLPPWHAARIPEELKIGP